MARIHDLEIERRRRMDAMRQTARRSVLRPRQPWGGAKVGRRKARRSFHPLWLIALPALLLMAYAASQGLRVADALRQVAGLAPRGMAAPAGMAVSVEGFARVVDGDTIVVGGTKVRLHGMDAPELHQGCIDAKGRRSPCGRQARRHLSRLIGWSRVRCRRVTTDRYGRMVAVCHAGDVDLARRMVRDGWAVAYIRYSRAYAAEETQARRARRGMWAGPFTRPETWRHAHPRR